MKLSEKEYTAIGWMYAMARDLAERGIDIRTLTTDEIMDEAEEALS